MSDRISAPDSKPPPPNPNVWQMIGAVPVVFLLLSTVAGAGYFLNNSTQVSIALAETRVQQSRMGDDMNKGFREVNETLRTLPLQVRQIQDLERGQNETRARLEEAAKLGRENRERMASALSAKDGEFERAINELRQAFALDHAEQVRMREQMNDFINGRMRK